MKYKKILSWTSVFVLFFPIASSQSFAAIKAVKKTVKILPAKPSLLTKLSSAPGDQISAMITTPTAIAYVGTMENSTVAPYTAPEIGGTDGFIAVIDSTGAPIWDLRLGTPGDDVATGITRDKAGFFWVLGATAKQSPAPTTPAAPTTVDSQTINVDGVVVEPVISPSESMSQLVVWKIAITGEVSATYLYDSPGVISPSSITYTGSKFLITGLLADVSSGHLFNVELDSLGNFTNFTSSKANSIGSNPIQIIKAGTSTIKSYLSSKAIPGIPSWKPKRAIPVVIKYAKSGAISGAYYLQGNMLAATWQSGIGVVAVSEIGDAYGITIIPELD